MLDRCVWWADSCECWKLRQQSEVGIVSVLGADGRARRGVGRNNTLNVQVSVCVNQLALLHVNQQSEVSQEVGTEDGLLYISDDENPWKRSSEPKVEGE